MPTYTIQGLGDVFSDIESGVVGAVTPTITAEAEAIIVPIIAPYALALVGLSLAGLVFGLTAYSEVKKLKKRLRPKALAPAPKPSAALAPTAPA